MTPDAPSHPEPIQPEAVRNMPASSKSGLAGRLQNLIDVIGLLPPKSGDDPYAHRRGEPRAFAVLWLAFVMIASAAVYTSIGSPVFASANGYRVASKVLMTVLALGVCAFWPMVRLSQARAARRDVAAGLKDLAIVLLPVQAFYWPQALLTGWGVESVAAASLLLAAWATGVSACLLAAHRLPPLVSSGRGSAGARAAWTAGMLSLPLIAPLVIGSGEGSSPGLMLASPLTGHWELLADRAWTGHQTRITDGHWRAIGVSWGACLSVWAVVLLSTRAQPAMPALAADRDRA
ncbi:MAG: hypothetical protein AAGF47_01160 [Planctomycetota bacterium]